MKPYLFSLSSVLLCSCLETEPAESTPLNAGVYVALGEDCCGEDPHPVHGAHIEDGSYVLVGKSIDAQGGTQGFVLQVNTDGLSDYVFLEDELIQQHSWSHTFGEEGAFNAANAVAVHESGIYVVGVSTVDGTPQRLLNKYDRSENLVWSASFPSSDGESAFEYISTTPSGGLILAGFVNGFEGGIEGFKSYGNPVGGEANVAYLSPELLDSNSAPSSFSWERAYDLNSIRSIRAVEDGFVFVAAYEEEWYEVVRIDGDGGELWRTPLLDHGEATDIAVLNDDSGFVVTGHVQKEGGIDGSVTKISPDGDILWGKSYGNPEGGSGQFSDLGSGNPALIFDECWGVQATENGGAIIACGTGIEGCDEVEGELYNECTSDPRTMWRSLLIEIDSNGEELWSRTDSYLFDGQEAAETASEYIVKGENGVYASVMDQGFGIGLLILGE